MAKIISKHRNSARGILTWLHWLYNISGNNHRCYRCGRSLRRFYHFRNGSGYAWKPYLTHIHPKIWSCPYCHAVCRQQHLCMYLDRLGLWSKIQNGDVLHFAPEDDIRARVEEHNPRVYVKGDLHPPSPDVQRIDITKIPFPDDSFDAIICCHVLEHVPEDMKALAELFRVLRPDGWAVLQTPYFPLLQNSFHDQAINTDELRTLYYGQNDHVRIYGRDLFAKIEHAGFDLQIRTHSEALSDIDAAYYGFDPTEDLILVTKDDAGTLVRAGTGGSTGSNSGAAWPVANDGKNRAKYENDNASPFPSHAKQGYTRLPASILGEVKPSKEGMANAKRVWKVIGYKGE